MGASPSYPTPDEIIDKVFSKLKDGQHRENTRLYNLNPESFSKTLITEISKVNKSCPGGHVSMDQYEQQYTKLKAEWDSSFSKSLDNMRKLDQIVAKQDEKLKQQDEKLTQQDEKLKQQDEKLKQQEMILKQQEMILKQQEIMLESKVKMQDMMSLMKQMSVSRDEFLNEKSLCKNFFNDVKVLQKQNQKLQKQILSMKSKIRHGEEMSDTMSVSVLSMASMPESVIIDCNDDLK